MQICIADNNSEIVGSTPTSIHSSSQWLEKLRGLLPVAGPEIRRAQKSRRGQVEAYLQVSSAIFRFGPERRRHQRS